MARPRLKALRKQFTELLSAGRTVDEAIRELRIGRTTAWRWRKELGVPVRSRTPRRHIEQQIEYQFLR